MRNASVVLLAALTLLQAGALATAQDPFADRVVEFIPGIGIPTEFDPNPEDDILPPSFDNPSTVLGEPTRVGAFGTVTPFSPPGVASEVVSIGFGGSLTVEFDEPVTNDPRNPFGIDLLVFGNSFLGLNFPPDFSTDETTTTDGTIGGNGGGVIEVSADGITFFEVVGAEADGLFPTNGFADITAPFPAPGAVESDFTLPVDPSITLGDLAGLTTAEVVALYDGSGGGLGIDIGALDLEEISFVRVTNPLGSGAIPEIDAFADVAAVPEPSALVLLLAGVGFAGGRRRV